MAAGDLMVRTSLYVGDLHPGVTEKELDATFRRVGPLVSVHLCRDKLSRKSLCYAYVNFWFPCHASTALKCLNHTTLRGKSMRLMWCQRDPSTRKNGIGNLFVKNLDKSITSARLQEIFSKYGTILSCKVAEENGISKGFGFVQFGSEDSAMAALNGFHNTVLEGKTLYVSKFIKKIDRKAAEPGFRSLYVKNLDEGITEDLLKDKFSEHGNVSSTVIMKDEKGKSKGFGFVNFDSHEAAKKAMEALNGELIGSKNLFVSRAQPQKKAERTKHFRQTYGYKCTDRLKESKTSNLYVKNLDASVDERRLEELFSSHGKVISAKVIRHDNGISKGFGFIHFSCPYEARKALNSLTGADFEGRTLYVALARRKEQQTSKLQKSYASKFPPQPLSTSNYQPTYCNFSHFSSPIPPKEPSSWLPTLYQNFVGPLNSSNPFQAHNFRAILCAFPMQLATPDGYSQNMSVEIWKGQKPLNRLQNKISNGDVKEFCKWSGPMKTFFMRPSPEDHKTRPDFMCCPPVQNLQTEYAASGNRLQLEMKV